ncbi:ABC transporter permease [Lawsonibacter celer]|uniref:ABC transporter permease n=1 Tax=Lawsonibacter celer TaxID=2986526 RepID=UPI0016491827|nr:ABC transporter permease subunit [Lawsonibacter celer]
MTQSNPVKRVKKKKEFNPINVIAPLVVLAIIYVGLEIFLRVFNVSEYVMPTPTHIIQGTIKSFHIILPDFLFTLKIICIGFCIAIPAGILLAALFSQFDLLVKAMQPVVIWLVITPMITLIPLMTLWLGTDPNLRVIIVIIQATPIICLNTLNGFTHVEREKLELARSVGATKLQTFLSITFMNAMPQVFTGIKLGCIFSTIGAVSADFVSRGRGLGDRIIKFMKYSNFEESYGCIILIALIGIGLYTIVSMIEKRVVLWKK